MQDAPAQAASSKPARRRLIQEGRLAVGLPDLTELESPRFAAMSGDVMVQASTR